MITADEIRERYMRFFAEREHRVVASAPLVPPDDPTLMFTSAGMVQFKALYSGDGPLPYRRAVTVQKCLRAGGKGSDLENVGRTLRHHTFFEMLGNFSFGDYFKKEAIAWAWEFCTDPKWLGLPPERIWATVFGKKTAGGWEADRDAKSYWEDGTGLINPVVYLDEKENYWGPAGDTGACGPCSEIKFFMGSDEEMKRYRDLARSGGKKAWETIERDIVEEGDLFLEIWNLVFPQYDQQPDGSRPPLKNRGIDTGAGLERTTTACQMIASGGKIWSPYETDLIAPIVNRVAELAGLPYPRLRGGEAAAEELKKQGREPDEVRLAINACADHARALTFALAEGIPISNEGRGYVIRRILRRAARFGKKIGLGDPFLWKLVAPVVDLMGEVYPELKQHPDQIEKSIRLEEERFNRTLNLGGEMLERIIAGRGAGDRLTGEEAFRLHDTYGYPLDLTMEICEERGMEVDVEGYEKALADGKARARASWRGGSGVDLGALVQDLRDAGVACEFIGHSTLAANGTIKALVLNDERVEGLREGQTGLVVLDRTPFYGEGGGQIGDRGVIRSLEGANLFRVDDSQKTEDGYVFHFGEALDELGIGQEVKAVVNDHRREATVKNHSATHLLQGALKRLVGSHVTQSGSYVGPDRLRFDFTHPEAIGHDKLIEVEALVNEQIQRNLPVTIETMALEEARATGAIAPFGEKYGHTVRVVKMGEFSTEFCGGTHVGATGEIGVMIITSESSVAAGIRRIEAQTGAEACRTIARDREIVGRLVQVLTCKPEAAVERVAALRAEIKALKREAEKARHKALSGRSAEFEVEKIGDVNVCISWIENADMKGLRGAMDSLASKHQGEKFVTILGSDGGGKATLIVGATESVAGTRFEAGQLIKEVGPLFDGRGGGKPRFAQAGGKDAAKLKAAIQGGSILKRLHQLT